MRNAKSNLSRRHNFICDTVQQLKRKSCIKNNILSPYALDGVNRKKKE